MKILLIGEYSSVHSTLKEGLTELGHEVVVASAGDGYRNIARDIDFAPKLRGKFGAIESSFRILEALPKFKGFDIVQLMNTIFFPVTLNRLNKFLFNSLTRHNKSLFLLGAGSIDQDSYIADYYKNKFPYPEYYTNLVKANKKNKWSLSSDGIKYNIFLHEKIDGYIPLMYEYAQGYRDVSCKKLYPTIPIPINTNKIEYNDNIINSKIIIFHGFSRPIEKGTFIIKEAMENIKKKYPNDVEIIIDGHMPLEEYQKTINKANVIIDQTYSISYGVNAVISMAMGKVVLGGGYPECLREFGVDYCPIIPILPNVKDIENKLSYIIENRNIIPEIGKRSRTYVENVHDYHKIAKKFINAWTCKNYK
jgi:glycosyltransferase involved in cell wall biosynthesis